MSEENKKQWKDDSEQLKRDLDGRQKVVKKREVDIKFGGKAQASSDGKNNKGPLSPARQDHSLRDQLGI